MQVEVGIGRIEASLGGLHAHLVPAAHLARINTSAYDELLGRTYAEIERLNVRFGHSVRYGAMTRNGRGETVGGIVLMLALGTIAKAGGATAAPGTPAVPDPWAAATARDGAA